MVGSGMAVTAAAPVKVTLELPLPPSGLAPNRAVGHHWGKSNGAKETYATVCFAKAREVVRACRPELPLKPPVTMILTFVLPDKRRRDLDGLYSAFKPAQDAMVRAGLLQDDGWTVLPRVGLEAILRTVVHG